METAKNHLTNKSSTLFLRAVVLAMGLAVLAICIFALPLGFQKEGPHGYAPLFLGLYAAAIPFYIALFEVLKLLKLIDQNLAFSERSVRSLRRIQYCALVISALFAAILPYVYKATQHVDAPGLMVIGLTFTATALTVAVFAAVLQKLLHSAIAIKSEHDLTV